MRGYVVHPHRLTRMQDAGLARSVSLAGAELERRARLAGTPGTAPRQPSDWSVLRGLLSVAWCELTTAWGAARRRRHAVKQLKRVDRRLLADVGIARGQIREVVDAMQSLDATRPEQSAPCPPAATWLDARPAV